MQSLVGIRQVSAGLDRKRRGKQRSGKLHRNRNAIPTQAQHKRATVKSATLPSLRVDPELRVAAESVLLEGETLSSLIETSVRETIERRRARSEFIARGLMSRNDAKRTGVYHPADKVHAELKRMLAKASTRVRA